MIYLGLVEDILDLGVYPHWTSRLIPLSSLDAASQAVRNVTLSNPKLPKEPELEARRRAYAICKERGHVAGFGRTFGSGPTKWDCKHCGTTFWAETVEHEDGAPE